MLTVTVSDSNRGSRVSGRVLLAVLFVGVVPALVSYLPNGPAADDAVALLMPPAFTALAALATVLLVVGWIEWGKGRNALAVVAAWLAVPIWMAWFSLVIVAAICAVTISVLAFRRHQHAARHPLQPA